MRFLDPLRHLKAVAKEKITWHRHRLRLTHRVRLPRPGDRAISVAIPHYNRADLVHLALFHLIDDPRVAEIVVLDDGSRPGQWTLLHRRLAPYARKVKLFRREVNWGAFANKHQCVSLCASDWVLLLDSDNTVRPDTLDTLFRLPRWDAGAIYCPVRAEPSFDFRRAYEGREIDFDVALRELRAGSFDDVFFNTGNYFVPRLPFVECLRPGRELHSSAADVVFANYLWLSQGRRLLPLPGFGYRHRVHPGSVWLNHQAASNAVLQTLRRRWTEGLRASDRPLGDDFAPRPQPWVDAVPHRR